jgi:hypothetical protein
VQVTPAPDGKTPDSELCPDLHAAIANHKVSFDQVCEAYFGQFDNKDQARMAEYGRLYPDLERTFGDVTGGPPTTYFTEPTARLRAGAAATGDNHFFLIYDLGLAPSDTVFLLSRLEHIETVSHAVLFGQYRAQFTEHAYNAATNILSLMESQALAAAAGPHSEPKDQDKERKDLDNRIKVAASELDDIAAFNESASQNIARLDYSKGMLIGLGLLTFFTLILNWAVAALGWLPDSTTHFIFYTMLTGGVGAVVSVISRASSLKLDYQVGHLQLTLLGMFRPLVGGIFGFIICALIRSKVVNFASPPDPSESLFYYAGAAFVSGFSERLAPGILESTGRRLTVPATRSLRQHK